MTQTLFKSSSIDDSVHKELNIKFPNIMLSPATIKDLIEEPLDHKITRLMDDRYKSDKFWLKIKAEMTKETGILTSKEVALLECQLQDDRLLF